MTRFPNHPIFKSPDALLNPAATAEIREHESHAADHDREQHPEHPVAAEAEVRQVDVHAVEARDERQRHEDRRDDREDLHDRVELIRDDRQVGIEQAGDAVLKEHRLVGEPHEVIVHVAKAVGDLLVDQLEFAPRQPADDVALRLDYAAERRDITLEIENLLREVRTVAVEYLLFERVETLGELVDL